MREPHVHLAYAPRGAGVLCAAFWVVSRADCYGWFTGAQAYEHPAHFFALENYYSTRETIAYRSVGEDVRAGWVRLHPGAKQPTAPPGRSPLTEAQCHEIEQLQVAFIREWLFYRDAPDAQPEAAALRARELPVMALNIRAHKLNKLRTDAAVWTFTSPGADLNVIGFLARGWILDYEPD
ncbi:MAG TPA: hypothetical protein VMG60_14665 [Burkholderiaceae bacterium]|nr:hypothetical protein [Burkholderiaceae bacterium]